MGGEKLVEFSWRGTNKRGRATAGNLLGSSEAAVRQILKRRGITVDVIKKPLLKKGKALSRQEVAALARNFSEMVSSGIQVMQCFEVMAASSQNPVQAKLLLDLRASVETGSTVAEAFRQHPKYFGDLFCNLLAAGEVGGILETMLKRLAEYEETSVAVRKKVKSALIYPAAVLGVAALVMGLIMVFVIPQFKDMFSGFGAELPLPTRITMSISEFFVHSWYLLVAGVVGVVGGVKLAFKRSKGFRAALDRASLKLPIFGPIIRASIMARWARSFALLFAAGVQLSEALSYVAAASGNTVYEDATNRIRLAVRTGTSLTDAMEDADLFDPFTLELARTGEESGNVDTALDRVATKFESQVDEAVKNIASLMEPLILVVIGGLVAGIVVSVYLPMFNMGKVV